MNSPSASPVTVVRIIHICVRAPCVAEATIWGQGLVEEIWDHHHFGICKTSVGAAAATVYQEPHFYGGEGQDISVWPNKIFVFESIAAHNLI